MYPGIVKVLYNKCQYVLYIGSMQVWDIAILSLDKLPDISFELDVILL